MIPFLVLISNLSGSLNTPCDFHPYPSIKNMTYVHTSTLTSSYADHILLNTSFLEKYLNRLKTTPIANKRVHMA